MLHSGWLFSCGVKTTMVLSVREKWGKSAVKEGGSEVTQRDASSESFIRNQQYECLRHAHSLA